MKKLFIWSGFCPDYTPGLAVAIARNEADARAMIEEKMKIDTEDQYWIDDWGELKILPLDENMAEYVKGGG